MANPPDAVTEPRVVLIVDDDPIVGESMVRAFHAPGFTAMLAASALEALALMQSVRVDAVIADLNMPGMNGVRFLTYVRDMFPTCVRVMCSGARHSDVTDLRMAGVRREHVLRKGMAPEELRSTVESALKVGRAVNGIT